MGEYIKETFQNKIYSSKAFDFYFKDLRVGVLDIETTGLSPQNSSFILGGILSFHENSMEQFFVENLSDEKKILEKYINRLSDFDVLITYNGQSFDIPYIIKRAAILGIDIDFKLPYNLDLYILLNNYSDLRKFLPNLKQKTVETFMGLWSERKDEISGKESIYYYFKYLDTRDVLIRETILLHNRDDLFQLSRLLPVIEKFDFHKAMHHFGFLINKSNVGSDFIRLNKICLDNKKLLVSGVQGSIPINHRSYGFGEMDYIIDFQIGKDFFEISFPILKHNNYLFLDIRKLLLDSTPLEKYPCFEKDFLVIKNNENISYLEINHFLKLFIKDIEVK